MEESEEEKDNGEDATMDPLDISQDSNKKA